MASSRHTVRVLAARACAKINLTLRLTGARPDGYHEVRTVLQSLALHDTLTARWAPGPFRIECDDPACPTDRTNLVWRAAEHVWRALGHRGVPRDVVIRIQKRIPLQAGLGGGSSDAAAAIGALTGLWGVPLADNRRHRIAAAIGADVPFFLRGGTALGVERGDVLFSLVDLAPAFVALVVPDFGVSTIAAYGWWDSDQRPRLPESVVDTAGSRPHEGRKGRRAGALAVGVSDDELRNDLEAPVSARHPEIARIVRALRRQGATHAAMSGSGSAVFGLFPSEAAAERAARAVATRGRRALVTRTIGRVEYQRLCAPR